MTGELEHGESELEQRLVANRPVPAPRFRGDLRRSLLNSPGVPKVSASRARVLIACYGGSGFCLLAAVAAGVAGVGPLAA